MKEEIQERISQILEEELSCCNRQALKKEAQNLSKKYCEEKRYNQNFISSKETALSYAMIRMPATYTASSYVIKELKSFVPNIPIKTVLDLGAGTGAFTLATLQEFPEAIGTCIEREETMQKIGEKMLDQMQVTWKQEDLKGASFEKADLVQEAYCLNEFEEQEARYIFEKMLDATNQFVILVEPGTPESFKKMRRYQALAKEKGFFVLAPCPCDDCPLFPTEDWCHSICRLSRTKLQRSLKDGTLGYEDEKFCYLILSKEQYPKDYQRILRHPQMAKGYVSLKLCTKEGIKEVKVTKKETTYGIVKKKKMRRTI